MKIIAIIAAQAIGFFPFAIPAIRDKAKPECLRDNRQAMAGDVCISGNEQNRAELGASARNVHHFVVCCLVDTAGRLQSAPVDPLHLGMVLMAVAKFGGFSNFDR